MVATRQLVPDDGLFAERTTATSSQTQSITPLPSSLLPSIVPEISPPEERSLTASQINAIRAAMKLFVEDDLARGVLGSGRIYCDGCERPRPSAGVITYGRYVLCNNCAIEYEVARARGAITMPGQYVRDKHFGDGDLHALAD
jgi:hypothetical protein